MVSTKKKHPGFIGGSMLEVYSGFQTIWAKFLKGFCAHTVNLNTKFFLINRHYGDNYLLQFNFLPHSVRQALPQPV